MLIGAALFARRDQPALTLAALAGGLVPDLALVGMVQWSVHVRGIPEPTVFGELYYSEAWQRMFGADHSFVVWGATLALALWFARPATVAFAGAALAHAAADFLLHHEDARRQFWPLSDWVFRSPVSYWDPARFGGIVAPVEAALVLVLAGLLVRRLRRWWERGLVLAVMSVQILPVVLTGGFHGLHGLG